MLVAAVAVATTTAVVAAAAAAAVVVVVVVFFFFFLSSYLSYTRSSFYLSLFLVVGRTLRVDNAPQLLRDRVCFCAIRATLFDCGGSREIPANSAPLQIFPPAWTHKEN